MFQQGGPGASQVVTHRCNIARRSLISGLAVIMAVFVIETASARDMLRAPVENYSMTNHGVRKRQPRPKSGLGTRSKERV